MGNNAAFSAFEDAVLAVYNPFSAFEDAVLAVYNRGKLDKELLSDLMKPYRDMDIDQGGMSGTLSKKLPGPDGVKRKLDVIEICIQTFTGKAPDEPPKLPKDTSTWTPEHEKANEKYWEKRDDAFSRITRKFGWG